MDPACFFGNFGAICTFAFLGTSISAVLISTFLWLMGKAGVCYSLSLIDAGIFGSLISATDPVTTLAVFSHLGADKNLFYLVFGESVLNDAVALVLYSTLMTFKTHTLTVGSVFLAVGRFLLVFLGSCLFGIVAGLLAALLFKQRFLHEPKLGNLSVCILVLVPFIAYMAAEAAGLSGIVSIIFNGIAMARYAQPNMTPENRKLSLDFFKILARLAETFVFAYMGVSLFLEGQAWDFGKKSGALYISPAGFWAFFFLTLGIMLSSRLLNVYPLSRLINTWRGARAPERKIPRKQQFMLWFSGLRGAIAFALAMKSILDLGEEVGYVIFTTTTLIVFLTVIALGGASASLIHKLDLKQASYAPLESDGSGGTHSKSREIGMVDLQHADSPGSPHTSDGQASRGYITRSDSLADGFKIVARRPTLESIDQEIMHRIFVSPRADANPFGDPPHFQSGAEIRAVVHADGEGAGGAAAPRRRNSADREDFAAAYQH